MAVNQEAVKFIEISESSFDALSSANINPNAFYVVRKNNGEYWLYQGSRFLGLKPDNIAFIIEVTQAEYDQLEPSPNTLYIITDADDIYDFGIW